eukprot:scaffold618_cov372-Prasinococcus_capsulatus_cf.AAC.4
MLQCRQQNTLPWSNASMRNRLRVYESNERLTECKAIQASDRDRVGLHNLEVTSVGLQVLYENASDLGFRT